MQPRLQIQESYAQLKPAVAKIFAAINERKKHEKRVKELMLELNAAKRKLEQSQQIVCLNVQDLVGKKQKFDSSKIKKLPPNPTILLPPRPKTPLVVEIPEIPLPAVKSPVSMVEETINFGDPNDIHKILEIKKLPIVETTLAKYISPLDSKRVETFDPLAIICPYEVDGNCRDKDCQFKHIL
ncbi:unnamed protein product [Brassicogethes aeneus]|uniref:Putative zinc-finger domain-containing protein n=1 Tax=Brassicogethes aeneus TaxID=1431903 RepID=A0A9P0BDW0_BRAAE|nr:unnamed protein product [Brassicogethes aeneus]